MIYLVALTVTDADGIKRHGLRGYIGSRPYYGSRASQHVQNLVIRDFCAKKNKPFLLSATEYVMPNCYMILEQVLGELPQLEGVVLYSLFMMPSDRARREKMWERLRQHKGILYTAVEGYKIETNDEIRNAENIWRLSETMPHCPRHI